MRDERHEEVIRRIVKVESVQESLREGIDQIKDEHDDFRVKYTKEVAALRGDLKIVLPQALAAIPQEYEEARLREQQREREERRLELQRTHVKWVIISVLIGALSGLAAWIGVATGLIHG